MATGVRTGFNTPPATMNHPGPWHYVATRLMAHMGAYSPDEMNRLHWQWHQAQPCASVQPCSSTTFGTSLGPRATKGTPQATGGRGPRTSWSLPSRRRAVTLRNAGGGHHPEWAPPLARTEAPCDRSPRGGAQVVLTPQGGKAARRNSRRRQGTLAAPAAAAARRLPRHCESSSMRIRTGTMEVPTTPAPNRRHLPPIPDADPRGHAPSGRTSPPFSHQLSASDWRRFTQAPTGQQTERPAHPPPPSQGRRPARCRGDSTPRTRNQGSPWPTKGLRKEWGDSPLQHPPPASWAR